ncbi:MAG: TauD/TfdA family dioxygenase [Novosphingobium sp.]|nr:TauD/TfdA family dioxygenase [Novosphingobium sp.]
MQSPQEPDNSLVAARPIPDAPFGYEVEIDLGHPLSDEQRDALKRAYRRDGLIVFRNQSLSRDAQIEACEIFGPAVRNPLDNYNVSNVEKDGLLGTEELLFHNDIPYVPAPFLGGSLHALDVAEGSAPTRFASAFRAWDAMPADLRARVEGLHALQVRGHLLGRRTMLTDLGAGDMCTVHPVVKRQEETDRPYLFVNLDMTACITTLAPGESEALIEELFSYLYDPANIYDHHWRPGDFVVWDNLAVQHARSQTGSAARTLQRVSIAEFGYWEQNPADLATYDELREMAKA